MRERGAVLKFFCMHALLTLRSQLAVRLSFIFVGEDTDSCGFLHANLSLLVD
jgi:hypothetical protein